MVIRTTSTFFACKSTLHLTVKVSVKSENRSHMRIKYFPVQWILCLEFSHVPTSPIKLHFVQCVDRKDAFASIFTEPDRQHKKAYF